MELLPTSKNGICFFPSVAYLLVLLASTNSCIGQYLHCGMGHIEWMYFRECPAYHNIFDRFFDQIKNAGIGNGDEFLSLLAAVCRYYTPHTFAPCTPLALHVCFKFCSSETTQQCKVLHIFSLCCIVICRKQCQNLYTLFTQK